MCLKIISNYTRRIVKHKILQKIVFIFIRIEKYTT